MNALFESDNVNGLMHGFTDNYIKVKTPYDPALVNQVKKVVLLDPGPDLAYTVRIESVPNLW